MLHFEGDKDFSRPPAEVWAKLRDARFLSQCVPGADAVKQAEMDVMVATVRPGFSFVRGTLEVTLRVVEATEPTRVRYHARSKGIGSHNVVEAVLTLAARDGGTRAHWTADVTELGGLLKAVPQGLIQAGAQKVIEDLWKEVANRL